MGKLLEQRNRALDDINAGRTVRKIRDLESRVRELEEELDAAYKAVDDNWVSHQQLVASQAYAEQLREAHKAVVRKANMLDVLPVAMISHNALALPRDTSALDAYVAEKVKEAMK